MYGAWALRHPDRLRIVAVVDPDPRRLQLVGELHDIPPARRFPTLPDDPGAVDGWIVAGPDRSHRDTALAAIGTGLPVLLEKPIAHTAAACVEVVDAAAHAGVLLQVALVLRETPFFRTVSEVVGSGELGDVVDVMHRENVAAWHMAHSFVRGSWSRSEASTPMVVQKACHDFDIVSWVTGRRFERLGSYGSLTHFRPEEAPAGATARCTDPCPVADCPFDARAIYLDQSVTGWPVHVITDDITASGRLAALQTGPYGRCVYTAGSDVVDHQVTAGELDGGATFSVTLHGHAPDEARTMRYEGTRATLRGRFGPRSEIEVIDHRTGRRRTVRIPPAQGGHGGGDDATVAGFVEAVARGAGPEASTGASVLEGHLAAFAAEAARVGGTSVAMGTFRETVGASP